MESLPPPQKSLTKQYLELREKFVDRKYRLMEEQENVRNGLNNEIPELLEEMRRKMGNYSVQVFKDVYEFMLVVNTWAMIRFNYIVSDFVRDN